MAGDYHVDLNHHLAQCESNYARVCMLLRGLDCGDAREFGVNGQRISLKVLECAPYTTLVEMSQCDSVTEWLPEQQLQIRVCHDARVAEVICSQGVRRVAARYAYPNRQMLQRDEKRQLNVFLGEWLGHCIDSGVSLEVDEIINAL